MIDSDSWDDVPSACSQECLFFLRFLRLPLFQVSKQAWEWPLCSSAGYGR